MEVKGFVGRRIAYKGDMANASGVGCVFAERKGSMLLSLSSGESSDVSLDVVLEDGRKMCGVSLFSIGGEFANKSKRFMFEDGECSDDEIAMMLAANVLRDANLKAKAEIVAAEFMKAKEAAKAAGLALGLVPAAEFKGRGCAAAYNLRRELKAKGFKVASLRSDGHSSIYASVSGGDAKAAAAIGDKYEAGSFDGMYVYDASAWGSVFGDVRYVNVRGAE